MPAPDGSTVGARLANLFADASIKARTVTAAAENANRAKATTAQLEEWERELSGFWKETLSWLEDEEDLTPEQKAMFAPLLKPGNQSDFFLSLVGAIGLMLVALPSAAAGLGLSIQQKSMKKWGRMPVPVEALVSGLVTGRFDRGYAQEMGAWQGFWLKEIDEMVTAARPSIPANEILELNRRGDISDGQADKWLEDAGFDQPQANILRMLKERIPDLGLVISAVTQSQLSDGQAQAFMQQHGIDPANYLWIRETAGQSPGVDLVLELLNKRLITEAEARTAVLESPIKNKYLEAMMKARFRIPPMEQTISMVRRGAYSPAQAADNLSRLGYFPDDIQALIDWATQEKVATPRDLTAGQIVDNYEIGLIDRATASSMLQGLRYDAQEATMYLDLADAKKARQKLDRAVSKVHSRYVAWKITDVEAVTALDALSVPITLRDELLAVWDIEREINRKDLTPAQTINAYFSGLLTKTEVTDRLRGMGYDDGDAKIYMHLQGITNESAEVVS